MYYSIGEVAGMTGVAVSTLRYYDREGFFPEMSRSSGGIRVFSQKEIQTLRVVECLKHAGMSIKDIKEFLVWCQQGDASLQKRHDMFHRRLQEVDKQIEALQNTRRMLEYKCWYYDTAIEKGSEEAVKQLPEDEIPPELRPYRL